MADTADTENRAGRPDPLLAVLLLLGALGVFGAIAYLTLTKAPLTAEEASFIVRSLWYAGPANVPHVAPYTATDATGQMPLYFYQLGFWQRVESIGPFSARLLSVGLGLVNAALLFFIARRLTANTLAAAAAVLILLATPATAYAFATATPTAMASALLLLATWLIVGSLGRPNFAVSALMGALCAVLYFYRQNTILAVALLVPVYIAALGRKRAVNALIVVVAAAAVTAAILYQFPEKLGEYALRLPVISPLLEKAGWLAPNFVLIDHGSTGLVSMAPAFARFSAAEVFDTFVLPYAGTIILALALFKLAGGPLKILWVAPLLFLGLAAAHYLAALGYCQGCMVGYTPYFAAFGALAAALALAMIAHRARLNGMPAAPMIMVGALIVVALNAFAPLAALRAEDKGGVIRRLASPTPEARDIDTVARWVAANVPGHEPVLVLHGLGNVKVPSLPYAVLLSEHPFPAQSIDPALTRRSVGTTLNAAGREAVQGALEEESLWSDATLARWIDRDFDFIIFQEDRSINQRAQIAALGQRFDLAATTTYRGATLYLYRRKAGQ